MEQNLGELSTVELNETSHFKKGIDEGLHFDELKKVRVLLRTIEEELKKRK